MIGKIIEIVILKLYVDIYVMLLYSYERKK
jgi:hypothetical protein